MSLVKMIVHGLDYLPEPKSVNMTFAEWKNKLFELHGMINLIDNEDDKKRAKAFLGDEIMETQDGNIHRSMTFRYTPADFNPTIYEYSIDSNDVRLEPLRHNRPIPSGSLSGFTYQYDYGYISNNSSEITFNHADNYESLS